MLFSAGFMTDNKNRHGGFLPRPTEAYWKNHFPDQPYIRFSVESLNENRPLMLRGSPIGSIHRNSQMKLGGDYFMYTVAFEVKRVLWVEVDRAFNALFETKVAHQYFPEFQLTKEGEKFMEHGYDAIVGTTPYEDFVEGGMRFPRLLLLNPKKSVTDITT